MHLDEDLEAQAREAQGERFQPDPWEDLIGTLVSGKPYVQINDVLRDLGLNAGEFKPQDSKRVAQCLRRLGWARKRREKQPDGKRPWAYVPPEAPTT